MVRKFIKVIIRACIEGMGELDEDETDKILVKGGCDYLFSISIYIPALQLSSVLARLCKLDFDRDGLPLNNL